MMPLDPKKYDISVWKEEDVEAVRKRCSRLRHEMRTQILTGKLDGIRGGQLLTLVDGLENRAEQQLRMKRVNSAMEHELRRRQWKPGDKPTISRKKPVSIDEFTRDFGGEQ